MLLERITIVELMDWLAFYELDPWGEHRQDLRMFVLGERMMRPHLKRHVQVPDPFYPHRSGYQQLAEKWESVLAFHNSIVRDADGKAHWSVN